MLSSALESVMLWLLFTSVHGICPTAVSQLFTSTHLHISLDSSGTLSSTPSCPVCILGRTIKWVLLVKTIILTSCPSPSGEVETGDFRSRLFTEAAAVLKFTLQSPIILKCCTLLKGEGLAVGDVSSE